MQSLEKILPSSYIIWRNYISCLRFLLREHGKSNYKNRWYEDCIEAVWNKTSLEIAWGFYGEKNGKSNYQTISHIDFAIKYP